MNSKPKNFIYYCKVVIIVIILFSISQSLLYSQDTIRKAFVSFHTGGYIPSRGDFDKIYGTPVAFINGLSLGIPFTNRDIYFYVKAMYYYKSGIPIVYHYTYNNGVSSTTTTQEGKIVINNWLFNGGIQENFSVGNNYKIHLNAGLSFVKSSEVVKTPPESKIALSGWAGYYIGIGGEKRFANLPFGVFVEYQYNLDRLIFKSLGLNYGGSDINTGLRFYFSQTIQN